MRYGYIYKITHVESGRAYIGQTRIGVAERLRQHVGADSYIGKALRKYGRSAFKVETIEQVPVEDLDRLECAYIISLGTLAPSGFNLAPGGRLSGGRQKGTPNKFKKDHVREMVRSGRVSELLEQIPTFPVERQATAWLTLIEYSYPKVAARRVLNVTKDRSAEAA